MFKEIIKLFPSSFFLLPTSRPFGLDISDYSIEMVYFEGSKEKPKLFALGREILTPGIIKDGRILDKENLIKILNNLIFNSQFGQIKTRKLLFSLPESKSFIHDFELPKGLKQNEIPDFIKSQIVQTFPFPLNELYFDSKIKGNRVLLVAGQREIINQYLEAFKICKLQPVALENESFSWSRALIKPRSEISLLWGKEKEGIVLIIDIGTETTNLVLFDGGEPILSFSIEIAGSHFTKVISKKLNIPPQKAEEIKKRVGLNPKLKEGKIFFILQKEILEIVEEIRKIDNYFQQKSGKKIEKIILIGGSSLLPFLPEYLSENLEKEVSIGNPFSKIDTSILKEKESLKDTFEIDSVFYSTAMGLALRGLEKNPRGTGINLIKDVK